MVESNVWCGVLNDTCGFTVKLFEMLHTTNKGHKYSYGVYYLSEYQSSIDVSVGSIVK